MSSGEDLNLVYMILVICVLAILGFFLYKLNSKVNELSEALINLKDELSLDENKKLDDIDETPKVNELKESPVEEKAVEEPPFEEKEELTDLNP